MSLETIDLPGVEILAADVRIHGRGSPPTGDLYSVDDLRTIAEANRELADELRPPAKIGHDGVGPAVGQLENIRVNGKKLLADVKRVPRRFAELVNSGAYGARSVELSRVTSQKTGRRYDFVVTALAWLGDRMPAVRTLDDVHALYEGDAELVRAYELHQPDATALIDEAVEVGRISVSSVDNWRRMFETDAGLAAELLHGRQPDTHRRMENRRELVAPAFSEEDERLYRSYAAETHGIRPEDVI